MISTLYLVKNVLFYFNKIKLNNFTMLLRFVINLNILVIVNHLYLFITQILCIASIIKE